MAEVVLKNVIKRYGKVTAVNDISFSIGDKEFYVLVGPSGCGKTTTLRMIAGLEEITEGEIHIDGKVVNDLPPKDRDIAMVFQSYALYPHMSVRDNMSFGLRLKRKKAALKLLKQQQRLKQRESQKAEKEKQQQEVPPQEQPQQEEKPPQEPQQQE